MNLGQTDNGETIICLMNRYGGRMVSKKKLVVKNLVGYKFDYSFERCTFCKISQRNLSRQWTFVSYYGSIMAQ